MIKGTLGHFSVYKEEGTAWTKCHEGEAIAWLILGRGFCSGQERGDLEACDLM